MLNENDCVLLIMPKYTINNNDWYTFPLGLPYISSYLKSKKINVQTLNLNHIDTNVEHAIKEKIKGNNVKVVGLSVTHILFNHCYNILEIVKKIDNNIITIIGGGVVTGAPKGSLEAYTNADIGITGEGEVTFFRLLQCLFKNKSFKNIKGVVYRDGTQIVVNPPSNDIIDISALPWPDYDGFNFSETLNANSRDGLVKQNVLPILSSRSCPYNCSFCFHTCGKKYRTRSLEDFFCELDFLLKKYSISLIVVYDELLTSNTLRLKEFCQKISKYGINWACSLRVDSITEETLKLMKESNCINASFGVEHISDTILCSMKKNITRQQIEEGLAMLYENDFAIDSNILFGDVAENLKTVQEAKEWLLVNKKYGLNICGILTLPGSIIFKYAIENNLIKNVGDYLKNGDFDINLTQVTMSEYTKIIQIIDELENDYFYFPDEYKYNIVDKRRTSISVVCKKCKTKFDSPAFPKAEKIKITCPKCNQAYILKPFEHFFEKSNNKYMFNNIKTIALVGRTYVAKCIIEYLNTHNPNIEVTIFDYSKKTCSISFFKKRTRFIDELKSRDFDLKIFCVTEPEYMDLQERYLLNDVLAASDLL